MSEHCEGCDLYRDATQTVFGAGPAESTVHPSAVLRAPDRESAYQELVADLRSAAAVLQRTTRR